MHNYRLYVLLLLLWYQSLFCWCKIWISRLSSFKLFAADSLPNRLFHGIPPRPPLYSAVLNGHLRFHLQTPKLESPCTRAHGQGLITTWNGKLSTSTTGSHYALINRNPDPPPPLHTALQLGVGWGGEGERGGYTFPAVNQESVHCMLWHIVVSVIGLLFSVRTNALQH